MLLGFASLPLTFVDREKLTFSEQILQFLHAIY